MWLANAGCPVHGPSSDEVPESVVGVLISSSKVEDGLGGGCVTKTMVTSDAACESCQHCVARPFTVLEAERLGLRSFPPIPKRCVLGLPIRGLDEEMLEALETAVSQDEIMTVSKNHVPRRKFARRRHDFERLQDTSSGMLFSNILRVDDALEGLRRRLRACDLDDGKLMEADLRIFPLLFWHVSQVTSLGEDQCLVAATRLIRRLGVECGKDMPLPPFHEMPLCVLEALEGFHAEIVETCEKLGHTRDMALARKLCDIDERKMKLKLRLDATAFDRQAYLEWGEAKNRPCCAFNFFNTKGCASCMRAFAKGHELDTLQKNPPDWLALEAQCAKLEEELIWMFFA